MFKMNVLFWNDRSIIKEKMFKNGITSNVLFWNVHSFIK